MELRGHWKDGAGNAIFGASTVELLASTLDMAGLYGLQHLLRLRMSYVLHDTLFELQELDKGELY